MKPFKMKEYRNKGQLLTSLCPWVIMADEGIVLLKNGAIASSWEFVAPDLDSSSPAKIASVASMFNNAIIQLGEGWAVQFELQRLETHDYPGAKFDNLAGYMIDMQRSITFTRTDKHFENRYFLTLTYQLPSEIEQKSSSFFYRQQKTNSFSYLVENQIKQFKMETSKVVAIISSYINIRRLTSDELFSYLHTSVSFNWNNLKLPRDYKLFLDRCITDSDLETSEPLKLGKYYMPIIAVKSFPSETIPAMFDAINSLDTELRWSTRFITYSKSAALKKIDKAEKQFHSRRKSLGQYVMEVTAKIESTREDSGATAQELDAKEAKAELTMGNIGFGDYISNIAVWDEDYRIAEEKAKYVAGAIGQCNFTAKEETHNALQAFLSMQPGNVYANIRSLFVSSINASHVIPISSIWSGLKNNTHLLQISGCGKPTIVCTTNKRIPFFLNINVEDVGHHWVSGPTGAGKSTYLALLELQWLKYPGARVVIFDKGLSSRNATISVGGKYIEPGKDDISFQPLAHIDTDEERRWASEFIELLLAEQNVQLDALMRKAIFTAITYLTEKPIEDRTLTSFWGYCDYQNPTTGQNDIRDGITPYLIGNQYGSLFDNVSTDFTIDFWTMFEMGTLMNMASGAVAPVLFYLFHLCEKNFDGKPTLLVLDEAWVFLKNAFFAQRIVEWLKTLRKLNVYVVFATQEIEDAIKSPIASTIVSQCASKVYLADELATSPLNRQAYHLFGLEESEISLLANLTKKKDYLYKSSIGTRSFQLGLDELQLGILTSSKEEHKILDNIEKKYGRNSGLILVKEVLSAKGISYAHLVKEGII